MQLVLILLIAFGLFSAASFLSVLSYGHFARRSRGAVTRALDRDPPFSTLDTAIGERVAAHEGKSGLTLVSDSLDAFAVRALSARSAGRSLDLMYYYWKDDLTGRLLANEIVQAADRGVRVRLLLDDINARGRDRIYLALDAHPNISVRLFNPARARERGLRRGLEMILRAVAINRRMHNKAWIADGRLAIVGGRNIGDEYFDAGRDANFRDLDIAMAGPVVQQAEAVFDEYWNSDVAMPIKVLVRSPEARLERLRQSHRALASSPDARPYMERVLGRISVPSMLYAGLDTHWTSDAHVIADPAEKASGRGGSNWMMTKLMPVLASADRKVAITSPYFVPGTEGVRGLVQLAQAGVDVAVLTNSLAATDVAAVHGGYAPYRRPLVEGGVRLYELQPFIQRPNMSLFGSRAASLHTKAFTVDGATGFVGSFNFDPRSVSLNCEMGVLFVAPELVARMDAIFEEETRPQMSWQVLVDPDGRLGWRDGGGVKRHEPEATPARRAVAAIVGWLPLESQL